MLKTVEGRLRGPDCGPLALVLCLAVAWTTPVLRAADASTGNVNGFSAFLTQNCAMCHSQKAKTAGIVLEGIDASNVAAHAPTLEKALRKVRTGEMPPPGIPRPPVAASAAFLKDLAASLDGASAANPNPGRPAIHRLNRAEYSNTIRDLLALDIQPGALLPVDDSGYGFDNVADVLSISPMLLDRYMSVARKVARLAVGDPSIKPAEDEFTFPKMGGRGRNDRVSDDLPFDSAGGMAIRYDFPVDAEYAFRIKMGGDNGAVQEMRLPVKAGLRTVGVTFLRDSTKPEIAAPPAGRRGPAAPPPPSLPAELDLRLDGARIKRFDLHEANGALPGLDKLTIAGPYNTTGPGDTASRQRIFVCRPASAQDEAPCAKKILTTLSRRAFRRPVTDADVRPLLAFYESGRKDGGFDRGIEKALRAMLVSPNFIFRTERDPSGVAPGTVYRISDVELASRLSFFLWSSIPDDQLLDLAEKGKLKDPEVLQAQVRRMLDDPRSQALVSNFGGQWLSLRNLAVQRPDPDKFPEFDENLRESFRKETELFFGYIVHEDRSLLELLDANYTFLNQRLAEHYNIPNVYGSQLRKVALTDPDRGGLLGQGSILTVTSYPDRTSVVQRGKWVLETLLGSPPPPPPPDIPDLIPHAKDGRNLTMREQMEQHRANAICASCHVRMDPLGFALENYDGVGRWRDKDSGNTIDASGKLPDGRQFSGPAELKKKLMAGHDEFINTATEKLLLYALGRGIEYYDKPAVRLIEREAAQDDYRVSALITAIVKSTPFQMRRSPEP
jgi:mono/diheme cytochrome c family protein